MKTVIKISLIVLAVSLIVFVVLYFANKDEAKDVGHIAKTKYVEKIADRAEKVIDKVDDYNQAKLNFIDLENEILAEKAMGNRSEEEIKNAQEFIVFYFAPKHIKHANEHYAGSEWSTEEVMEIKTVAQRLLDYQVIEDSAANRIGLNKVITVADHYAEARALASSSRRYSSAAQVESIMSEVKAYKNEDPLKNCTQLRNDLDGAVNRAVNNYASSVAGQLNSIANQMASSDDPGALRQKADGIYREFSTLGRPNSAVSAAYNRVKSF
ncbi:MAG: hypothetical protein J6X70_07525 [Muribaculaceae bacterium]|nr:hypothetical protein [Muribaculaceae bacterium]